MKSHNVTRLNLRAVGFAVFALGLTAAASACRAEEAKAPPAIVEKLNSTLQEIMSNPATLKLWANSGVAPYPKDQRSPAAARTLLKSEIARWTQVVRDNQIQASPQ